MFTWAAVPRNGMVFATDLDSGLWATRRVPGALVLGLVNTLIRPVLVLLTLPVTLLSMGLFILVINALLFWLVSRWVEGFEVAGFWSAFLAAILYSVISWALSTLLLKDDGNA